MSESSEPGFTSLVEENPETIEVQVMGMDINDIHDMSWITGDGDGDGDNSASGGGVDAFSIQELSERVKILEDQVTPHAPFFPLLAELLERCTNLENELKTTRKELLMIKEEMQSTSRSGRKSSDHQQRGANANDEIPPPEYSSDHEMKPYICKFCSGPDQMVMIFQDATGLAEHYTTQHPYSAGPVLTEPKEKNSSQELQELPSQVGPNLESKPTTTKRKIISKSNEILIPEARSDVHECHECNATFIHSSHLSRHRMSVHSAPTLTCEFCEKVFHRRDKLKRHQLTIHKKVSEAVAEPIRPTPPSATKYPCPDGCGRGFPDRWTAGQHLNSCRGLKPYVCDQCGVAYRWKKSLNEHKVKIHSRDEAEMDRLVESTRVLCSTCGLNVLRKKLQQHLRTHSGLKRQRREPPPPGPPPKDPLAEEDDQPLKPEPQSTSRRRRSELISI